MSLSRRSAIQVGWAYGSFLIERIIGLAVVVILARVLAPETFSVVAAAILVATIIDALRDFGIREALIKEGGLGQKTLNTGFYISILAGLVQSILLFLLSPLGVYLVEDPEITGVLQLMALIFPITALGSVHDALLSRELRFLARGIGDVIAATVKIVVVIGCLEAGLGLWSFPIGLIASAIARTTARWLSCPWRPGWRLSLRKAKSLLKFGMHVSFVSVADPILDRADQFAIAILLSDRSLSLYIVALRLPELLIGSTCTVFARVLYPVFVRIDGTEGALRHAWLRTTRLSLMIIAPIALGLAIVAAESLRLLFGEEWVAAAPVQVLMCLTFLAAAIDWFTGDVHKARGRPEWISRMTVLEAAYTVPTIWIVSAVAGDMVMTAASMLVCVSVAAVVRVGLTCRFLEVRFIDFLSAIRGPLAAACGMVGFVLLAGWVVDPSDSLTRLGLSVVVGVSTYAGLIMLVEGREVLMLLNILSTRDSLGRRISGRG